MTSGMPQRKTIFKRKERHFNETLFIPITNPLSKREREDSRKEVKRNGTSFREVCLYFTLLYLCGITIQHDRDQEELSLILVLVTSALDNLIEGRAVWME